MEEHCPLREESIFGNAEMRNTCRRSELIRIDFHILLRLKLANMMVLHKYIRHRWPSSQASSSSLSLSFSTESLMLVSLLLHHLKQHSHAASDASY
jgi:hypothetical protein